MDASQSYLEDLDGYKKRRSKTDWAGVSIGDAFKQNIDYYFRLQAQREFYQAVKKVQVAIARKTMTLDPETPRVKPQLSPFYTNYPSILSAYAAIGLTGYLEFEARVREKILFTHLAGYLNNPAQHDNVQADPRIYQQMANIVAKYIQIRLVLEDLSRFPEVSYIEMHRIFSASQQSTKFQSIPEILRAVILFADILPDWQGQDLHPVTRSLLKDITEVSMPFAERLSHIPNDKMLEFGGEWVKNICLCLAKHLPEKAENINPKDCEELKNVKELFSRKKTELLNNQFKSVLEQQFPHDEIAPLNSPKAPSLFDPRSMTEQISNNLRERSSDERKKDPSGSVSYDTQKELTIKKDLINFISAIEKAGSQQRSWEDVRSDILERALRALVFNQGPIQGNPTDGHVVTMMLGGCRASTGEIFDRAIELSDDLAGYESLVDESKPITDALRRSLYPNLDQVPETERFKTSGSIDPSRLATAEVSASFFKRYRIHEKADWRGSPVLLIACDASGSLNANQIKMLKVLTTAWLISTARSRVKVVAGLYHSENVRPGLAAPLVQWIYHPKKTPAVSRIDAARALVSLPRSGTGRQSDALSLAFMLDEAYQIANGRMVYLILITDCKWNQSLNIKKTGYQEVYSFFQKTYRENPDKLHTTLVALGVLERTGFEDILDKVITVSHAQLSDYRAVAEKIGTYVASCMKERHRWLKGQRTKRRPQCLIKLIPPAKGN